MIDWISNWLREIIMIVLLATFFHLLLPNNAINRYVRVVLSLFILMTILSPIVALFKTNLSGDFWQQEVVDTHGYQSLEEIMHAGDQIKANNEQYAQHIIEQNIAKRIKEQLKTALPGQIDEVAIKTVIDDQQIEIVQVHITLTSPAYETQQALKDDSLHEKGLVHIEPVQMVVINIDFEHINEEHVLSKSENQAHVADEEQYATIFRILEQDWHVSSQQVTLTYVEEISSLFGQGVAEWESSYKNLNYG